MEDLPPRPRRKLVTPATLGLAAVAIAAGGFIGGVEVQKHQGDGNGKSAASSVIAAFASRAGRVGGPAAGDFTTGTVANKHGGTLYVRDQNGTTIRVKTSSSSKVTRTASSSPKSVHPGDTVIITGTKHSDGSITASSIRATSKAATSAGGGGFLAGGGPPAGAGGAFKLSPGG